MGGTLLRLHQNGGGKQVNPELRNLIALQDLELKIAELQKQASEVPDKIQSFDSELQRIESIHQEREGHLQELTKKRRTLETEVDTRRDKLSRLKDQLMAVKTNKEYTAMLHEIQMAEDHIRTEEDRILEVMEEIESMEKDFNGAEQEMKKRSIELKESIKLTHDSVPQLESALDKLFEEKAFMESQIGAELLSRYRKIAGARKGVALAEAKEELCGACHVRIRPQVYAEVLRTENIHVCDSCSRILFSRENL
jgi:predicted  nucleic acid-binding Zn-ribbon protein